MAKLIVGFFQMSQFVTEDVQTVMINDAGVYSHPIIVAVESPDQINEVFDVISYSKVRSRTLVLYLHSAPSLVIKVIHEELLPLLAH